VKRFFQPLLLIAAGTTAVLSCIADSPPEIAKPAAVPDPVVSGDDNLTFVYIHGFGGLKENPKFCENMREFLDETGGNSKVVNYEWDSVDLDLKRAGEGWQRAQRNADREAPRFKREIIDKLERSGEPYVLVGFSVGSRVVLRVLESIDQPLTGLQGVYFLGSAMTKDTTLKQRTALPNGMKIINYHSPNRDVVHKVAFNFMSANPAGGQVGFDDDAVFDNYPVSCSHAHKGGLATDYSGLAEAIGYLELWDRGVVVPGTTKLNLETSVMEGEIWWNKLRRIRVNDDDGRPVLVELEQHNTRPGYYRALRIAEDGTRSRIARGENLHAIMKALGTPTTR
jgi:predicted esterase